MTFSLRGKLFVLVAAAISMAALPIIFLSRDQLMESGMQRERASFVNTVMLVEDSLGVRYLQLLTTEVESVLHAKNDLRQTASMISAMLLSDDSPDTKERALKNWRRVLAETGRHLALYDAQGQPLMGDSLIASATMEGRSDFKGQSMRSMLVPRKGQKDCQFAVARVQHGARQESPVLVCFAPAGSVGTVVLAVPVADTRESRWLFETRMMQGMRERLDSLELSGGASIAIIAADGRVLAGKGQPLSLDTVPDEILTRVRDGEVLEGETVGKSGLEFLYRLAYFKALDWYVVAAVPLSSITEPAEALTRHLLAVAGGLLAISLFIMLVLTMRIIAPLRLLTKKAEELAAENFSIENTGFSQKLMEGLPANRQDEVGQLAGAFAHMVKALDENIRSLLENMTVRQRMQGELNAARDIQMGILPAPDSAPHCENYEAAAFLEPAKEVGGDLYDFFTAPDGRQAVVIGDVSDKGVSAALFMSMTVTLVRYALAEGLSCAEAMLRINERLAENNPSCMFVTLFIGLFDPATGRLDYASGAHCPPFVVSPQAEVPVRALTDTSGPLVGAMQGLDYEACHAELAPGEYCLLYTDGVSEAMNETKELFGEERIAEVLDGLREAAPDDVLNGVMDAVRQHRGTAAQSDDITMLCFRRAVV